MSPQPQVSILLPVRDAAETLGPCLDSIRRQRGVDWELVAVDDGSRDESPALLAQAEREDPRIRLLRQTPQGIVAALQRGLAECRAPLVARMDGDDWMHRDRLRLQREALLADGDTAILGCHVRCFPRRDLTDGMRKYERWLRGIRDGAAVRRERFVECPLAHPTWLAKTEVLQSLGYRDRGWPEDYDLILRAVERGYGVSVLPRRLLGWRDGPSRLQRTDPAYAVDRFVACKAAFLSEGFLPESPGYVLWGHGGTGRAIKRALREHGREPEAIVELHRGRLGNRIDGAPVIPPERLPEYRGYPILVSVAGEDARGKIRRALRGMGFVEERDYLCVA